MCVRNNLPRNLLTKMTKTAYEDTVVILKVKNWQTADKYAVCFSRLHGKIEFIAYGARSARTNGGRMVQPFAVLNMQFFGGKRLDSMKSCELEKYPSQMDIKQMAYASLIAEVAENLTEAHQPQEEIFELLLLSFDLLLERNPRIVALSALCKLLYLTGVLPNCLTCVNCGAEIEGDARFSTVQGGSICDDCSGGEELSFGAEARELLQALLLLDFGNPTSLKIRGGALMELEKILLKFIVYQTDKPLKSLDFIAQTFG